MQLLSFWQKQSHRADQLPLISYSVRLFGFLAGELHYVLSTGSFGFPSVPLMVNPSISFASNPNSLRISSLCSPSSGARLAGTLVTPCTGIGLLIVLFRFPPAPARGTMMPFSLNCGSLITS